MADKLSKEERSALMSRIRGKHTAPELTVRRMAHALGYRFRLHMKELPGSPDLVFPRLGCVIYVNGCFWHGHDCKEGHRVPKSNKAYWVQKIEGNRARDRRNRRKIRRWGWRALVIWECQLRDDDWLARRLSWFLEGKSKR